MTCSRCNSEAIVMRGAAAYCAKCALARDWEDVIAIVQEDRVEVTPSQPVEEPAPPPQEPAHVGANPSDNGGLNADPFEET